jgi:hypothetical protein
MKLRTINRLFLRSTFVDSPQVHMVLVCLRCFKWIECKRFQFSKRNEASYVLCTFYAKNAVIN